MSTSFYTNGELQASRICYAAGLISINTNVNNVRESADIILRLAEQIKNERAVATLDMTAANLQQY